MAGVFGGLMLSVVEIGWNCDDGLGYWLFEIGFGCFFYFLKGEGGDLWGWYLFVVGFDLGVVIVVFYDVIGDEVYVFFGYGVVEGVAD